PFARASLCSAAAGVRRGHVCDVADLRGEVRGHRVDVLGQVFPDAGHLAHLRLTAELAFGADLARHARHLGGEHAELLDHGVDDAGRAQELALPRTAAALRAHRLRQTTPPLDRRAVKRSCSACDAPPLTRLSGISAGTALGDGPLALSSPTGSSFGCIVSSGTDEPAHDVTGAGALSRPYRGAAAIFGHAGVSQWSRGT